MGKMASFASQMCIDGWHCDFSLWIWILCRFELFSFFIEWPFFCSPFLFDDNLYIALPLNPVSGIFKSFFFFWKNKNTHFFSFWKKKLMLQFIIDCRCGETPAVDKYRSYYFSAYHNCKHGRNKSRQLLECNENKIFSYVALPNAMKKWTGVNRPPLKHTLNTQ